MSKIKINFKMPPESVAQKLYRRQQELRKKSGLPDPEEYKKRMQQYDKEPGMKKESTYVDEKPDTGGDSRNTKSVVSDVDPQKKKRMDGALAVANKTSEQPGAAQKIGEAGPFSYGAKPPRRNSLADRIAKKRQELQRKQPPMEPRDQMVGTAKVMRNEAAWGRDKMANLQAAHDRHAEKAIAANRAGDHEAVKVHQSKMGMIKTQMNKLRKEDTDHIVEVNHRIGLTVTDPNHPMVSKRKETIQKTVRVSGEDRENAIKRAIAHYRRKGYKVHDHHYIGTVNEEVELIEKYTENDIANGGTVIYKHEGKHYMSKVSHKTGAGAGTKIHTTSALGHVVPLHHVVSTDASDWNTYKNRPVKEEVEQVDELRTSTLLRYATKANKSLIGGDRNKEEKRIKGIQKANYKIQTRHRVKEDAELAEAEFEVGHSHHKTTRMTYSRLEAKNAKDAIAKSQKPGHELVHVYNMDKETFHHPETGRKKSNQYEQVEEAWTQGNRNPQRGVKVGDKVRSYDFPGMHDDHYIEGHVVADNPHTYHIRVNKVVRSGKEIPVPAHMQHVEAPKGRGMFSNAYAVHKMMAKQQSVTAAPEPMTGAQKTFSQLRKKA